MFYQNFVFFPRKHGELSEISSEVEFYYRNVWIGDVDSNEN